MKTIYVKEISFRLLLFRNNAGSPRRRGKVFNSTTRSEKRGFYGQTMSFATANNIIGFYSQWYQSRFEEDILKKQAIPSSRDILQVKDLSSTDVLDKLTDFLGPTIEKMENSQPISFTIPSRGKKYQFYDSARNRYLLENNMATKLSSGGTSVRAANTVFVMMIIYELLRNGKRTTLRAIYYKVAPMFKNQKECDSTIDDIACFLLCRRENLNIVAADKGEVVGNLSYTVEGDRIECLKRSQVIPDSKGLAGIQSKARFILVIEKHSTFFELCEHQFFDKMPCILITARGYPDVTTRRFLNILSVELKIPVFGLFDSDPFGFHIFSVYKCGSENMSYDSANLTTPDMKWLGILPSDIGKYNIPRFCGINMTEYDILSCHRMLREKNIVSDHDSLK
ncbi:DNA topoisomerase 6 subunit A3-like, partial [Trifolium pratense]|uniref:DNA topoisomerase 6 subunit A3-like n=2 Tax=Trifolium pratense TaxID=57577 RepID=UPI001E692605